MKCQVIVCNSKSIKISLQMWFLGSSWQQKQQEWTDSGYIEKRELGDGGTWRVRKREEEMTTPLGEGWACSQKRAIQEEEQIWGKDRLGFLDKLGVPRCWNDWQFIKKECFDLKRKVMIRTTDVSVIEAWKYVELSREGLFLEKIWGLKMNPWGRSTVSD